MTGHFLYVKLAESFGVVKYRLERWTTEHVENRVSYQAQKLVVKCSKSNLAANHKRSFLDIDAGSSVVQYSINILGNGPELTLTNFADDTKLGGHVEC